MMRLFAVLAVSCAVSAVAHAQAPVVDELAPQAFDPSKCVKAAAPVRTAEPDGVAPPPVTWSGFELSGQLTEDAATVRTLFEPTMQRHRALTDAARDDIKQLGEAFGYHLVGLGTKDTPEGTKAIVHLAPLPIVRAVEVDVERRWRDVTLDDEIRRRMRVRTGSYLAWNPSERACELSDETQRIKDYLLDEGYFEARVSIRARRSADAVVLTVKAELGPAYETGVINLAARPPDAISDDEIRAKFRHQDLCIVTFCFGQARWSTTRHQTDLQAVVDLFHKKGYPAVRVRSDFDRATSFVRRSKKVDFTITIDQRRLVEVVFEGHNPASVTEADLRDQLTFNQAASSDDVEAGESAKAVAAYLQSRGFFDARVTWTRERFERFDRIVFRIDQGQLRRVRGVDFAGNVAPGFDDDTLQDLIATQVAGGISSSIFGKRAAPTSLQLATDVDRIVNAYRRAGYRDARVWVTAATEPAALDSPALSAALALAERGRDLYVRFHIDEGLPTLLVQVRVDLGKGDAIATADERELCALVLGELASMYNEPQLARPAADLRDGARCVAAIAGFKFREADAAETRDQLRDRLFSHGRPRAKVTYETALLGPRRIAATYKVSDVQELRIGKIVIRGNFRTRPSIIRDLLRLDEGKPLTKDALAAGARELRNSGLFDAVNVAMPDLDNTSEGSVNAVVEVTERYDYGAQVLVESGYSSYNGLFLTLNPSLRNITGRGISLDLEFTGGFDTEELFTNRNLTPKQLAAESRLVIPQWLTRDVSPIPFRTELTAFQRLQDTPRFGELTTQGVTLALARTVDRPRVGSVPARALTYNLHYDFRRRERPVDVLRPPGADDSEAQVPITTRTGSVGFGFEWEQRVDRNGTLSPLAPEGGFRLEGRASFASPFLAGQDTFVKLSAAGSKWWSVGSNLVLRADLRYDQGIPLGGAVLLPEVERFFAGGDSTVRGYEDDRLATEVIQVGVPPYDNVQQIRILPAGGNIRVMSSLDAQLRIWKIIATGAFVDAGMITNQWSTVTEDDIRPSVGIALVRLVTPFGTGAFERAMPLRPHLGDDPRGRWHLSFAARAQF